jgi:H+/gluconate symporter-like permease
MKLNKKTVIWIGVILGIVALIIIIIQWQKRLTQKSIAESITAQAEAQAMANQMQVDAAEQCSQNWFCATTSILGNVGNIVGGFI